MSEHTAADEIDELTMKRLKVSELTAASLEALRAALETAYDQGWVAAKCSDPFDSNPYRKENIDD